MGLFISPQLEVTHLTRRPGVRNIQHAQPLVIIGHIEVAAAQSHIVGCAVGVVGAQLIQGRNLEVALRTEAVEALVLAVARHAGDVVCLVVDAGAADGVEAFLAQVVVFGAGGVAELVADHLTVNADPWGQGVDLAVPDVAAVGRCVLQAGVVAAAQVDLVIALQAGGHVVAPVGRRREGGRGGNCHAQYLQTAATVGHIGVAPGHSHTHGSPRRVVAICFSRVGRVADVYHPQAVLVVGYIGMVSGHGHVLGIARCIVGTGFAGAGRVGNVDHAQCVVVGHIGVVSGHGHAIGIARRVVETDFDGAGRVGNVDHAQPFVVIGHVGGVPGHGHAIGNSRRVVGTDFYGTGRVGNVDHAQAIPKIGHVGVVPGHGHAIGIARRVVGTGFDGTGRVGNVDHAQATPNIGHVGVVPGHSHAIGNARRIVGTGFDGTGRVGNVDHAQPFVVIGYVGVVPGHGHGFSSARRVVGTDFGQQGRWRRNRRRTEFQGPVGNLALVAPRLVVYPQLPRALGRLALRRTERRFRAELAAEGGRAAADQRVGLVIQLSVGEVVARTTLAIEQGDLLAIGGDEIARQISVPGMLDVDGQVDVVHTEIVRHGDAGERGLMIVDGHRRVAAGVGLAGQVG